MAGSEALPRGRLDRSCRSRVWLFGCSWQASACSARSTRCLRLRSPFRRIVPAIERGEHLVQAVAHAPSATMRIWAGSVRRNGACRSGRGQEPDARQKAESAESSRTPTGSAPSATACGAMARRSIAMPSEVYTKLTDADLGAVIAYVKQVPPVDRGGASRAASDRWGALCLPWAR